MESSGFIGFLSMGLTMIVLWAANFERLDQRSQLVLVLFGCTLTGLGVILAPDETDNG